MKVGIDIGSVTGNRTGIGNYCYYLVKHLLQLDDTWELKAFSTGLRRIDARQWGRPLFHRHLPIPTRLAYTMWEHWGKPAVDTLLHGVDVYHATNYFLPPTSVAKRVVTIHDLSFLAAPHLCSPRIVGPFSRHIARFAREAHGILVYSESTARDIERLLEVPSTKIHVAPLAVDESIGPMPREEAAAQVCRICGVQGPFILFVGMIEPRKNIPTLLRAFQKIAREIPHQLVLAGPLGWNPEEYQHVRDEMQLGDRVVHTGYVDDHAALAAFYSAADLFVFPSLYEGFGLPVLEAMACGCPVLASGNSSMPEVTGGAAVLLPADDADAWAETMKGLLHDSSRRAALSEAGRARAAAFSWKDCAARTFGVYRSVAACA
ncbi:MAG TPA: glycosyltransferase family 1 protein [Candidatus Hydrogenedentes bacterium]|jgi:glycosyltransferase involved in cell wall biosynthesis|nr:glycosyltransferase family 1 protein [Candidatus Hydrogenedentota bacterium]